MNQYCKGLWRRITDPWCYNKEGNVVKVNLAWYMPALFRLTGLSGLCLNYYNELYNVIIKRRFIEGDGQPND
jgi:hypothetical protein